MIKIVHLTTSLEMGGAQMMLYKLLSRMDRARFCNIVVSMIAPGPIAPKIAELGVPVYSLHMQPSRPSIQGIRALLALLRREQPDVLQTWMYHANLLGQLCGARAKTPRILWNIRGSHRKPNGTSRMTQLTMQAGAWLSKQPDAVVINTEVGQRLHINGGYHPRRWEVIPNGFELNRYAPDDHARAAVRRELGIDDHTVLIGLIGRFHPMKDHATFFRAANVLAARAPNVHWLLAGPHIDAANAALMQLIDGTRVQPNVHLLGERHDVPRLMAALDLLTLASSYGEGFSNTIGEAMACGTPCVVTDVGDAAAIVGDTGIVVPPSDALALAAAWLHLIKAGPITRHALGHLARARVQRKYSLDQIVQRYEALYTSLF